MKIALVAMILVVAGCGEATVSAVNLPDGASCWEEYIPLESDPAYDHFCHVNGDTVQGCYRRVGCDQSYSVSIKGLYPEGFN